MATSGNAILPGGLYNPTPILASGSGLGGLVDGLAGVGSGSAGLTALASATVDVTLSGPNGPGLSVNPNVALTGGATGSPLAPVTGAANTLTGGATGALLGTASGAAPTLAVGAGQTPSIAGQPITLLAGATPLLSSAAPVTNTVGNVVSPVTSTLVNGVAAATAPSTSSGGATGGSPAGGTSGGSTGGGTTGGLPVVSGLGALTQLTPPLLHR
ncbi:MAG: hypothetical protein EON88_23760 [Brevundimonas sp.]|nr:MAG: hypothetical protein EON88_23760 [Brevundimonas sp.]